jgi:hypothetical protein
MGLDDGVVALIVLCMLKVEVRARCTIGAGTLIVSYAGGSLDYWRCLGFALGGKRWTLYTL